MRNDQSRFTLRLVSRKRQYMPRLKRSAAEKLLQTIDSVRACAPHVGYMLNYNNNNSNYDDFSPCKKAIQCVHVLVQC